MKKFNAKFIVSAMIAASMLTASAVSASAAEYRHYSSGTVNTSSAATDSSSTSTPVTPDTNTGTNGTSADSPATVLSDDAVKELIKNGKTEAFMTEDSSGNAIVSEAAIGEIAKSDKPITINVDVKDGIDYSVKIDPAKITSVKAINLAMDISVPTSDKEISGTKVPEGAIIITPAQKGEFGMTLEITIPASALKSIDLNDAKVYYIADDGSVELLANALVKKTIAISHASAYVITDEDLLADSGSEITLPDEKDDQKSEGTGNKGNDDTTVTVVDGGNDSNPVTGTTLALGSLAVFAAAAAVTSKKRK